MAVNPLTIFRKLDGLLQLEANHGEAIKRLTAEVRELQGRVSRLEAREDVIMERAQGAASSAAFAASTASLTDLARRIGALEERSRQQRLPPPEKAT